MNSLALFILWNVSLSVALQSPGDTSTISGWHLQSTQRLENKNLGFWSLPSTDVASWHRVGPRSTVFGGLVGSNVYHESDLFYSDRLASVDQSAFQTPWLYREEFSLPSLSPDQHLFLIVHGITSKADIFLNGRQVVSSKVQRGSYAGHTYEITQHASASNALLIQAHPTDPLRDLAVGFGDWNPPPPDNSTGVWRDVELKLTGPVSLSDPRITTNFTTDQVKTPLVVSVTVKTDVINHGNAEINAILQGTIYSPDPCHPQAIQLSQRVHLLPRQNTTVALTTSISNPEIWWPAQWGSQPLYKLHLNISLDSGAVSDIAPPTPFGIRSVTSTLNQYNDTLFAVNGHPFLVRGAGYAPDIFLRFDLPQLRSIFQYVLDMGLNTVRLEGKQEHPELYSLADDMGIMIMAGWECCDKWEGWEYNHDADGQKWLNETDYTTAFASLLHEAAMMQPHPSLLAFLIGSDYWPNARATALYLSALRRMDWPNPTIAAASKRGHPPQLPPSGLKMDGPYDWIPPVYWYGDTLGAAFGFGSELGAGVGTPELASLQEFLGPEDLDRLWRDPDGRQYHLSPAGSVFDNRGIYNKALGARYGAVGGLETYVARAQMMDYEATRAQFEAFAVRQSGKRPATGVVYWMLNQAWPSLHWQLFDYYLRPAGAYFGAKVGLRSEHVVYEYARREVYVVNHLLHTKGARRVVVDLVAVNGTQLGHREAVVQTRPRSSQRVLAVPEIGTMGEDVAFLRLGLFDQEKMLSRNVYWVAREEDVLNWDDSTWYSTPVTSYANFTALSRMEAASVEATGVLAGPTQIEVVLHNTGDVPAFFLRLTIVDPTSQEELAPVFWSDNYITLLGHEKISLTVQLSEKRPWMAVMKGGNVPEQVVGRG